MSAAPPRSLTRADTSLLALVYGESNGSEDVGSIPFWDSYPDEGHAQLSQTEYHNNDWDHAQRQRQSVPMLSIPYEGALPLL